MLSHEFHCFYYLKNGIETLPSPQVATKAIQISMAPSGNIAQGLPDCGHLHGLWATDINTDPGYNGTMDPGMAFGGSIAWTSLWPQVAAQAMDI